MIVNYMHMSTIIWCKPYTRCPLPPTPNNYLTEGPFLERYPFSIFVYFPPVKNRICTPCGRPIIIVLGEPIVCQ